MFAEAANLTKPMAAIDTTGVIVSKADNDGLHPTL